VLDALARASAFSFLLLAAALPWSVAPISIALVLCAALTLLLWQFPGSAAVRWERTPVDLPALVWILALSIASLFALDPGSSWPRVVKGFLLLLVPVAAYHARDEKTARLAIAVLFVSAGLAAIFALGRFVAQGPEFPNRVKGAVGHPLTYGGQALLIASLATAIAMRSRGAWRVGALLLLGVTLPALAGSYTRSAWIGYIAALAVIVAFTRARWLAGLAGGLAALALVLPGAYRERAFSIFDPQSPWNRERLHMWEAGARMLRDHPWTGVGLQDLHSVYETYKPPGAIEPAGHLHSVYVQVAATMGVIGILALLFLIAGLLRAASRAFRNARRSGFLAEPFGPAVSLGVSAALVGFLVSGLMEWNLGDEELLDLLCVLVGIAFAASAWRGARRSAGAGDLALVETLADQSLGAIAKRCLNQPTSPASPAR
jgi:O-antigen ligase